MAQTQGSTKPMKFGYTNVSYILSVMPESKQIESELGTYSRQLENQLKAKAEDFQSRVENYERGQTTMTAEARANTERELQQMQTQIQQFQQEAENNLQKKQMSLLEPVTEKISKAIRSVAEENGYTYIFNSDAGLGTTQILLHAPDEDNVTNLVLKKLGVQPPANATGASK
ncbi:outer membrane protein [Catalinimonas alkaloidigena]|uniref:Outer membrane protein n=2 Tax=Catalinimonas alkaloidigena TaxID=1075417 RepID=A0A1G9DVB8_9BACT|nr:outer membrane protein [Catalinimonas alkaloidigena]